MSTSKNGFGAKQKRSEIYRKAADLIDRVGRSCGHYKHPNGKMCIVGALRQVALGSAYHCTLDTWLTEPMRVADVTGGESVTGFSDYHCKTKRDMVAAMRIAADISETKGD